MFRMSAKVVLCQLCDFVQLCDMSEFLTHVSSVLVASALVSSWLDYCNSLFRSLCQFNLCKLQCIQNGVPRIASNTRRYTSITPVLKKLHWLSVEHRSIFKTATFFYKFLHTGFPKYFAPYISSYSSSYSTRCSQSVGTFLVIPKFQPSIHKSVKQSCYSFALVSLIVSLLLLSASFRKQLKTYLYTKSYPPPHVLCGPLKLVNCFGFIVP